MLLVTFITHAVSGWTAGKVVTRGARRSGLFWTLAVLLPVIPDLDVVGFAIGIPYESPLGHRGLSHSLFFALLAGAAAARVCRVRDAGFPGGFKGLFLFFSALTASHGLLDAMTHWPAGLEGVGVAFFAPFDNSRYFLPWRPIPVSPIGLYFFSHGGWKVLLFELLFVVTPLLAAYLFLRLLSRRGAADGLR